MPLTGRFNRHIVSVIFTIGSVGNAQQIRRWLENVDDAFLTRLIFDFIKTYKTRFLREAQRVQQIDVTDQIGTFAVGILQAERNARLDLKK